VHRILHRIGARHVFFRGNSCYPRILAAS
jgi:hypothetical protein